VSWLEGSLIAAYTTSATFRPFTTARFCL
jgi:hypothetical protein